MWLALHAHRAHPQQYPLIIKQAQEACRVLRRWMQGTPMETAQVKESPKQVRAARKGKGKTASVRAVAAATRKPKASRVAPTTPKRPRSKYATTILFVVSNLCLLQSPTHLKSLDRSPSSRPRKMSLSCGNLLVGLYHF
jgi:hypothetical protein